jgi:hypothetical protein
MRKSISITEYRYSDYRKRIVLRMAFLDGDSDDDHDVWADDAEE